MEVVVKNPQFCQLQQGRQQRGSRSDNGCRVKIDQYQGRQVGPLFPQEYIVRFQIQVKDLIPVQQTNHLGKTVDDLLPFGGFGLRQISNCGGCAVLLERHGISTPLCEDEAAPYSEETFFFDDGNDGRRVNTYALESLRDSKIAEGQ
ncbi:MAG TPA: hypothetical protein VN444_03430 [Verrucomicrobiae bacterium]|nr:hypothetical protein [Verrucomicrobiae bacterium]